MLRVYTGARFVGGVGVALILVLFILGIAISNREIFMPILRLREATAAVGRGELNVRLLSDAADPTFRKDELGDLARDFDEMTRQLQKNVNQLARSNEAKRRFMELAGHELLHAGDVPGGGVPVMQRQPVAGARGGGDGWKAGGMRTRSRRSAPEQRCGGDAICPGEDCGQDGAAVADHR